MSVFKRGHKKQDPAYCRRRQLLSRARACSSNNEAITCFERFTRKRSTQGWLEALGVRMCHVDGDLLTCDTREDLTKRGNRSCVLGEVVRAYCTC